LHNKVDAVKPMEATPDALRVSAQTGQGLDDLRAQLLHMAGWDNQAEGVYMARERHLQALTQVQAHLDSADEALSQGQPPLDVLAEELRLAQQALGQITGAFDADDLLGVIFSRFCIGK
jgi:tRNA modification GTPase